MPRYTVRITSSSGSHDFTLSPEVEIEDVERVQREGVNPPETAYLVRRITLDFELEAGTPAAVLAAWSSFAGAHLYNSSGAEPIGIQIRDSGGAAIPEIGEISTAAGWQDLRVVSAKFPPLGHQFVAAVACRLVFEGRLNFPDSQGRAELGQELTEFGGPDGLPRRRLVSTVRLANKSLDVRNLLTAAPVLRLARPAGWRYVGDSNNPYGAVIRLTKYPLLHEAEVESTIAQLGGGVTLPALAGEGTREDELETDRATGTTLATRRARITGSANPLGWVGGPSNRPAGVEGATRHDVGGRRAEGVWQTRSAAFLSGRTTRVRVRFELLPSGHPLGERRTTGGFASSISRGAWKTARLVEVIQVFALSPPSFADVHVPPPVSLPTWEHDSSKGRIVPAQIADYGGSSDHDLWVAQLLRFYVWLGTTDPLADGPTQAFLHAQFLGGATDGDRTLARIA